MSESSLEHINNAISECMDKDEQPWDYYDLLQSSQNGRYYYDSSHLIKSNEISVPKAIFDSIHTQNANANANASGVFGGFFESINRAYFVMDCCIYLWDYTNKTRWCCLNQFNDAITAVCLVDAKHNIFIEKIKYLLIVATKLEIRMIGIGFTNNCISGEIEAFPTKYCISTDNVVINKIVADKHTKRIFLCCDHGNVYEFEYFYSQNLFGQHSRKCRKTNISDSFTSKLLKSLTLPENSKQELMSNSIMDLVIHHDICGAKCLFSLSLNGDINAYLFYYHNHHHYDAQQQQQQQQQQTPPQQPQQQHVEPPPSAPQQYESTTIRKVLTYSAKKLYNEIQLQVQQMTDDNQAYFFNRSHGHNKLLDIVKLVEIDKYESQHCQLMAITRNGDRLFFEITCSSSSAAAASASNARRAITASSKWSMELSFIRIRPPYTKANHHVTSSSSSSISSAPDAVNVDMLSFEPSIQASSPSSVSGNACFHSNGVTFMNSFKANNQNDCLLLMWRNDIETQKSKYVRPQLFESIECDSVSGRDNNCILSVCKMPLERYYSASSFLLYSRKEIKKLNAGKPFVGLSQFAIEHLLPSPIYLCLRKHSITFYKLQRYIDRFKVLLLSRNYEHIFHFIRKIGFIECQIMCLLILINHDEMESDDEDEDEDAEMPQEMVTVHGDAREAHAQQHVVQQRQQHKVIKNEAFNVLQAETDHEVDYLYQDIMQRLNHLSPKLLSVYLCLSRIVRPIWPSTICIIDIQHNNVISARYSYDELFNILNALRKLRKLLGRLTFLNVDKAHYDCLQVWLSKCIEILHILIMLTRCKFVNIYDELDGDLQTLLKHISFEQLLVKPNGSLLLEKIISVLISKLNDNDIQNLHRNCPTYFTSAQFMTFLAQSHLNNKSTLKDALKMYCDVCGDKSFDLENACNSLKNAKYYTGVVQLVFTLQRKLIAGIQEIQKQKQVLQQETSSYRQQQQNQQQLHYYNVEMMQLKNRIIAGWQHIFDSLKILFVDHAHLTVNSHDYEHLMHNQHRVLSACLQQTNKDFAYKLYQWFLDNKMMQLLFKHKPKYLEEFLGETRLDEQDEPDVDMLRQQPVEQQQVVQQERRNHRLIKLVHYYKENREILKMVQLLDALTKTPGFSLEDRNNFLIEAKRATKSLNNNGSNFDPHTVNNDQYNQLEERSVLCGIQMKALNELERRARRPLLEHEHPNDDGMTEQQQDAMTTQHDLRTLHSKLLNLEQIYQISKRHRLFECCLDCLSFANDSNTMGHVNGCWFLYIADVINTYKQHWTQYLLENLHKMVNKYNVHQQPWMFDANTIVFYLNKTNLQTHKKASPHIIVDMIYPKIEYLTFGKVLAVYKSIFQQIPEQHKVSILQSIQYLLSKNARYQQQQQQQQQQQHVQQQQMFLLSSSSSLLNPRVLSSEAVNNSQIAEPSTNVLALDVIAACMTYLERHHFDDGINKQFQELHDKYSSGCL